MAVVVRGIKQVLDRHDLRLIVQDAVRLIIENLVGERYDITHLFARGEVGVGETGEENGVKLRRQKLGPEHVDSQTAGVGAVEYSANTESE